MDNFNIDKNIYNKESLMLLNIRDLRDIGRTFGVPSPTTKSKDELIDYILKIIYGEVKGEVRSTRGRPNSRSFNMEKYVSAIKKRSIMKPDELAYQFGDVDFTLKLASPTTNHSSSAEIVQRVFIKDEKGAFLKVHGFVDSKQDIKVSSELEEKFKLENFDMAEVVVMEGLFKIVSINGKKLENNVENLSVLGHTFENGGYEVFHYSTKEEIEKQVVEICNTCKDINIKTLVFANSNFVCECDELVCFDEEENDDLQVYKKLMEFIALAEKKIALNEEFVAMVTDMNAVEQAIGVFDSQVAERTKKHLQGKIELFAKLGNVLLIFKRDEENVIY